MKKELLIASVFAATIAGAGSVTTSNNMGYVPVDAANSTTADGKKMYMVVAPFEGYDNGKIALADVIQTAGLAVGDEIFIPNGAGYDNWKLNSDKAWSEAKTATIDAQGKVQYGTSLSATEAKIDRGKAFWVKTAATSLSLFGNAVTAVAQVSAVGGGTKNAWTMIGSTLNGEIKVSSIGGNKGDVIILANGTRYTRAASDWYKTPTGEAASLVTDSDVIAAGVGFWYASKSDFKQEL